MKIYYTGNLCSDNEFDKIIRKSKVKPSVAGLVFENMLLKGFKNIDGVEVDVRTYINQAAFPNGKDLFVPTKTELLECGWTAKWIPTININGIKQLCFKFFSFFDAFFWMYKNRKEDAVFLTYSIYGFMNSAALFWAKRFNIQTCAIIPDLPRNHFEIRKARGIKQIFGNLFLGDSLNCQTRFDKYVLLTEYMKEAVDISGKPYTVVEGISNPDIFKGIDACEKKEKAIMYAGMLSSKHRTDMLIRAFMKTGGDYKLWIFGSGDIEEYVRECAKEDKRIVFFGRVSREEVLEYECRASLLVNVRDSSEQYTRYSFPSKTMEYMSSGTPLLTTRLSGIPEEYFEYVYALDNETEEGLSERINELLSKSDEELKRKGQEARTFVEENKNYTVQARKIYDLLRKQ